MKITIVGYGFVGRAFQSILQPHYDVKIVDPKYNNNKIKDDTDAVVVCVSTPEGLGGICNMHNVHEAVRQSPDVPILIKSTISLEGWNHCKKTYGKSMSFSPEFMREASAMKDVKECEYVLLGGDDVDFWTEIFKTIYNAPYIHIAKPQELILAKYFRNAFLATKVSFFNQIFDLCKASGIDFKEVSAAIVCDPRINSSHAEVTKQRGYAGSCLPKDVKAIVASALYYGINLSILQDVVKYNQHIRDEANKK